MRDTRLPEETYVMLTAPRDTDFPVLADELLNALIQHTSQPVCDREMVDKLIQQYESLMS